MDLTESGVLQLLSWTLLWKFCVQSFITGYFKLKDMAWDKLPLLTDQNCSIHFFSKVIKNVDAIELKGPSLIM